MTPARGAWTYWRPEDGAVVELATVCGRDVGLPAHFHDEHQFTFVLRGRRSFVIGDRRVVVPAGMGAWIPAGVAHRSTPERAGVVCVNAYVAAAPAATAPLVDVLRRHPSVTAAADEVGMSREGYSRLFASRYRMPPRAYRRVMQLNVARQLLRAGEGIAAAAAQSGFADQSHLGRWFRRVFGTTPGRYRARASSQPF